MHERACRNVNGNLPSAFLDVFVWLKHKGRTLILLKPSTYMNLSGKAVRYWMEAEKIAPENLLVV